MAGFGVDVLGTNILYADNVDFSGNVEQTKQISTNGQLLIGSTAAPNIKSGFLGSTDGSITWTLGSGTITGQVTGGTTVGKTITGNTGGALSPLAGNWNIIGAALSAGTNASVTSGSGNTLTVTSINTAKWIVDPIANRGTHQTITGALAVASSGETIFIRPGTYTENLNLKAGVNIFSYIGSEQTPNVSIVGNMTYSVAGSLTISGIRLTTNGSAFLSVSGSAASVVNLENCFLNCLDATGISFTSSNASAFIRIRDCDGNLGTTGIGLYSMSSTGIMNIEFSTMNNTGASVTASNNSAGSVQVGKSTLNIPFSTSSTGSFNVFAGTTITTSATNTACLTMAGTGVGRSELALYDSGTASAISIGVGCTYTILSSTIRSSNTNAITGAGTINYAGLSFSGTSNINTTTKSVLSEGSSRTIGSANTGAANVLTVNNTSNTATSSAQVAISTAGSTADDPTLLMTTTTTSWIIGVDNSVTVPTADPFVISQGSVLGTNNIMSVATSGEINYPLQPAFLATLNTTVANVTGDGTVFTLGTTTALTERFDQNGDFNTNGTFTAPVTGRYAFYSCIRFTTVGVLHTIISTSITSSNLDYIVTDLNGTARDSNNNMSMPASTILDMDAADTCTTNMTAFNSTKTVGCLGSNTQGVSFFSGYLVC